MSDDALTLQQILSQHPERTLVIDDDEEYTAAQLLTAAQAIRGNHAELASSCVAVQFANALQTIIHLIALDGFAARILLLSPELTGSPLESITRSANADFLVHGNGLRPLFPQQAFISEKNHTEWLFTTSGTSGTPKAFSHTLKSLSTTVNSGVTDGDCYRWGLAYQAHRFAGVQVILQALINGNVLVTSSSTDLAKQAMQFSAQRVNSLSATPSLWRSYLMQGTITSCKLLQITLGGEIADQAVLSALREQFPQARIAHIYASTEAGVGFSVTDGKAGFPEHWLDSDSPINLRISESGTLQIKSPGISNSKSLATRLSNDGYLDTQDCVQLENGRVYFLGRSSGVINVGGNKVYPEEVESLVLSFPEIRYARVIAKPSPVLGELVSLEVQARPMSSEEQKILKSRIITSCKNQLQKYKVPAFVRFVDELKVAESGKLDRKKPG